MQEIDYYGELSSAQEKKVVKEEEKNKGKDYYAELSAGLVPPKKEDVTSLPDAAAYLGRKVVEKSHLLQKLASMSPNPMVSMVGKSFLPPSAEYLNVKKVPGDVIKTGQEFINQVGIQGYEPNYLKARANLKEQEAASKVAARMAIDYIKNAPEGGLPMPPPPKSGVDKIAGIASGVGETVSDLVGFVPDLLTDLVTDPAGTIQNRPLDLLFMIEGSAGPRIRFKAKSYIAKYKAGLITSKDMNNIFRQIASEDIKGWKVPEIGEGLKKIMFGENLLPEAGISAGKNLLPQNASRVGFEVGPGGIVSQPGQPMPEVRQLSGAPGPDRMLGPAARFEAPVSGPAVSPGQPIPQVPQLPQRATPPPTDFYGTPFGTSIPANMPKELPPARARATYTQELGAGGRKVPGLMAQFVDNEGRPISYREGFNRQKNVSAAEDFIVSATGSVRPKPDGKPIPAPTKPVGPGGQLIEDIRATLKKGEQMQPGQAELTSAEMGQRMATGIKNSENLTGRAKSLAVKGALKGPVERMPLNELVDKYSKKPEVVDGLHDMINNSEYLSKWEQVSATDALDGMLIEGRLPQPHAIEELSRVFGQDFVKSLESSGSKWFRRMLELGNFPRSMMANFDLSAPLRQGIFFFGEPKLFAQAFGKMFKYAGSDEAYQGLIKSIIKDPNYGLMKKGGVDFTHIGRGVAKAEEQFASELAEKIPGVKMSERAFSGMLDKLRADVFNKWYNLYVKKWETLGKPGVNPADDIKFLKSLGAAVNNGSGRGSLPHIKGIAQASALLNSTFFSPRLLMSRFNLSMNPHYWIKMHPFVRQRMLKTAAIDIVAGATTLGLAKMAGFDVTLNPSSPDFGKMKMGNVRLDPWGGFSQWYRALGQTIKFFAWVSTGMDGKKPVDASQVWSRFLNYKLSPVPSLVAEMAKWKKSTGEDFNLPSEIANRLIPMWFSDVYQLGKEDPKLLWEAIPSLFGAGVQTYEEKRKKRKIY